MSKQNELRADNIELIARWMAQYVRSGHPLTFVTRCGDEPDDNEILFRVADWPAFSQIMSEVALEERPGALSRPPHAAA